jgi:predicted transcriptional regulator
MRERVEASPYGFGLVVGAAGTVLGRLRKTGLRGDPSARVEEVMEPGPSTVRLDASLEELVERLRARDLKTAIVTTPDGRLVGVLRRRNAEARLDRLGETG